MNFRLALSLLLGVAGVAGVASSATPLAGKLVLTGSSTVAPLVSELGKRFEELHPGVRVDVQSGGSSRGVADARQGLADIGMVSRGLKADERDLIAHTIALDGIGVILNSANAIKSLSREQIVSIYTGKITNWKAVGGRDARITVVNKAEGRSTLELFLAYTNLKASEIVAQIIIGDNEQGIKTVAGNQDAIGYVSVGSAEFGEANGIKIKLLAAGSTPASTANIKNGSYELSRPLNLVTKHSPSGLASAFIEFAKSVQVNDIIKNQYFVPVASSSTN